MTNFTVRALALGALLAAGACSGQQPGQQPPAGQSPRMSIAVIPKGTSHVFWQSIHAGARKAAQEQDVEVIWRGPLREDDRDSQVSEVEGFVSGGRVAGIVLAPLDEAALVGPVSSAQRAKIPVVIIDSGLKGEDYVSFVATDNYKGGRLAGEHLAKLLGGKGKVVLLRYNEGSDSTNKREQGFLDAIKDNPGIQVVSSNQYGGADVEGAYKKSESLLSTYKKPDGLSVDGIFTPNESTAFAMLRVLQDNGWAGKVRFVGFDASENLVKGLRDGAIDGLVLQDPVRMGYLGVKTMVAHLKGEKVERRVDTGVQLVTRENMDQPETKELLSPDLSKWLK